ncbi:hypothetical protein Q7P35_002230 [Cladosporium inversicolor]
MDDKHTGNEAVWYEDVVGNLETFTRLSKAGHFERANLFFERKLKSYSEEIPVAAQYANSLIDQGAFRAAEEFLTNHQPWKTATGSEVATETQVFTVFRLMLTITQLYTKFEPIKAAEVALSAIKEAGTVTIGEGMSQINLQIVILSLRIVDLVRRVPSLSDDIRLVLPFQTRSQRRPELGWEDAIIALLTSQHLWQAQTLLEIHIRHHGITAVSKPNDILNAVPRKQDAMYTLAYLMILALLSKTLSWEKSVTETHLQHWKESYENKIDLLSRPMDDITDPVTTSRAYQKFMVLQRTTALAVAKGGNGDQESTANFTSSRDASEALAGLRDLRFEASCHEDYLLAMEIYEASGDVLPDEYIQATGASKEAIGLFYPDIRLLDSLQTATERGNADMVENLLAVGTNVNAGSGDQDVPDDDSVEATHERESSDHEESLGARHKVTSEAVYNQAKLKNPEKTNLRAVQESTDDLEGALDAARQAVDSTPMDHPDRAAYLSTLSYVLSRRYELTRDIEDLEEATSVARKAVQVTPVDHSDHATYLSMLSNMLSREAAENRSLDREAERARYRRSFDPLHRLPDTLHPPRSTTGSDHSSWSRHTSPPAPPSYPRPTRSDHSSWSRHTSPPAPPSYPRPTQTRTRFASLSPFSAVSTHRHRNYGHATVHQYHYSDSPAVPASSSRRPSDSIRDRGREVIERERAKAANEDSLQNRASATAEEYIASPGTSQRWEPVFDEVDERTGGREYYYVTEGSAQQEIRRRRDRDDSRRREERRGRTD